MMPIITDYFDLKFKASSEEPLNLSDQEVIKIIKSFDHDMNQDINGGNIP